MNVLKPVPGLRQEDLVKMTRQQRWKLRRYTQGMCVSCGKIPRCEQSRTLCSECLAIQRERMRQRTGASRRNLRSRSYDADKVVARFTAAPARRGKKVKGKVTRRSKFRAQAKGKARPAGPHEPTA